MKTPIYFDNHATTPTDSRVVDAMVAYATQKFGHDASRDPRFGWQAAKAADDAPNQSADRNGASTKESVFSRRPTESHNPEINGVGEMYAEKGNHILPDAPEHKAVLDTCK